MAFLLFLPLGVSAQGVWISEAELIQLEEALTTAQNELETSQQELTTLKIQSEALRIDLLKLSKSYDDFVSAVINREKVLTIALAVTSALAVGLGFIALTH